MVKNYEEALKMFQKKEEIEDYSTDKARKAMMALGNPLKDIKVIHIAGTNGKGSTAKMMFSILNKAGFNVGVYTQPNLVSIRERFETSKGLISEDDFVEMLNKVLNIPFELAFFEKSTLMAFLYFQKSNCEFAIIEVGLGGLLDTTNIVDPYICAITSIGYDHMMTLGNTLDEISFQKAGIIKPGIPIVVNHRNRVIEEIALEKDSELIYTTEKRETNLKGDWQARNAGIAYEIAKYIGVNEEIINKGLLNVVNRGRLEYLEDNLLIDGAHNINGLNELKSYLSSIDDKYKKINYCFSMKYNKDINFILDIFGEDKSYIIVDNDNVMTERTSIIEEGLKQYTSDYQVLDADSIRELSKRNARELYVVFGSLYMIGEFYK